MYVNDYTSDYGTSDGLHVIHKDSFRNLQTDKLHPYLFGRHIFITLSARVNQTALIFQHLRMFFCESERSGHTKSGEKSSKVTDVSRRNEKNMKIDMDGIIQP